MPSPTPEQFRDMVIAAVERIGRDLGPDDDWFPVMLMHTERGFEIMPLIDPDGDIDMSSQEGLVRIAALLEEIKPEIVARVQMGWGRSATEKSDGTLKADGDRQEMLLVQVASPGFYEMWFAEVKRGGEHPEIVEWEVSEETTGPLAEALKLRISET